jgi:hypothetical protein
LSEVGISALPFQRLRQPPPRHFPLTLLFDPTLPQQIAQIGPNAADQGCRGFMPLALRLNDPVGNLRRAEGFPIGPAEGVRNQPIQLTAAEQLAPAKPLRRDGIRPIFPVENPQRGVYIGQLLLVVSNALLELLDLSRERGSAIF